jgi:transcriptional regulator with XRE-family HTH domain
MKVTKPEVFDELKTIGDMLKKFRHSRNLSLRAFCIKYDFDAKSLSKIERGILDEVQIEEI